MERIPGMICIHHSKLRDPYEVIFIREMDPHPTSLVNDGGREVYHRTDQLEPTGIMFQETTKPKEKKSWTLGVDPIPEAAFKKGRKR